MIICFFLFSFRMFRYVLFILACEREMYHEIATLRMRKLTAFTSVWFTIIRIKFHLPFLYL